MQLQWKYSTHSLTHAHAHTRTHARAHAHTHTHNHTHTTHAQEKRFQDRIDTPAKRWKLSPFDLTARSK